VNLMLREKLDLAKELAQSAKQNAALRRQVLELEVELFWLKVGPKSTALPQSVQQALDTIDAQSMRRQERLQAEQQRTGAERRAPAAP